MLAFVHIEKCGGTTLNDLLRRNFVLDHCDVIPRQRDAMLFSPDDLRDLLRLRPSTKCISGHSIRLQCGLDSVVPGITYFTCLRDPIKRYLSDFFHFVDLLGFPPDFEAWLERTDRHNFQTRAIAGEPDLARARQLLDTSFSVVGILEQLDDFLAALQTLARDSIGFDLDIRYRVCNTRSKRRQPATSPSIDLPQYADRIREVNALDIELYEHVLSRSRCGQQDSLQPPQEETIASQANGSATLSERYNDARKLATWRLYRNLIYKPFMGYWPVAHSLPVYREQRKAA